MNRREFLQLLGVSGVATGLPLNLQALTAGVTGASFLSLPISREDKLNTISGITHNIFLRWGDPLNATQKFGYDNDFIAFHPMGKDRALMWVNHENVNPLYVNGPARTKENIDRERLEVGGSILEVKKVKDQWVMVKDSKYNRRLDATTEIDIAWHEPIQGSKTAIGTLSNCAGGKTPWGTILTCEENPQNFYGSRDRKGNFEKSDLRWEEIYPLPPEHYGWVVEVDPLTGKSKKLISIGRFGHEACAVTKAKNGKAVAYSGDDRPEEHFYKFISDSNNSLEKGKLYVANLEKGEWISMDIEDQPILKKNFKNQTEIQVFAREAAKMVGATPLARPEDIEFDPESGDVLVTLTNNKLKNNFHGSILRITEDKNDPASLKFKHEVFLAGGPEHGFSSPDNMVFDKAGNLWFTTDVSGSDINKGVYADYGNNGLYVFLRSGKNKGKVIRLATGPIDAEFTGPCFSPDGKTLFLSVQHPGELTRTLSEPTSKWPDGDRPKSCVVTLQGPLLDQIIAGKA